MRQFYLSDEFVEHHVAPDVEFHLLITLRLYVL